MKQQIETFMQCTGNDNPSFDNMDKEYVFKKLNQLTDFMDEEFNVELKEDGLQAEDIVAVVDAIADIEVFHTQMVLLLERAGVDYKGVCDAICTNNSLKFTTSAELAERWLNEWQSEGNFNYYVSGTEVNGQMYYCLKHLKAKKVSKWKGFPQVSLKEFIPEKYLNEEVK